MSATSPFAAAATRSARAQNVKTFNKTAKDIQDAYDNGASSKEEKRFAPEYGSSMNTMDEAKANIANRRRKAAGMNGFGKLKEGATAKAFAEVSGENRDMRTPEQKTKDIAAASAGRTNADIAASKPAPPSGASAVMQNDEPSQGAFSQANRSGSLSSRGPTKVGRSYNSDARSRERFNRRNEQASRMAYGF